MTLSFVTQFLENRVGLVSDIHNPTLRFFHRWISFTLFPTRERRSVTVPEFKCLFAMVRRIRYSPVADIIDHFREICTQTEPIECTSLVTPIALNLGWQICHEWCSFLGTCRP